ncbi:MAG: hypothetical protein ACRYG4_21230 [Janthinobacterium lividum]
MGGTAPATLAPQPPVPSSRRLQIYAFDPSLAIDNATAAFATATVSVPWREPYDAPFEAGPVNEYLEVVDVDPESGAYYQPVDLDDPYLLATDGYPPSESNPQFHQQMAFAVASYTIQTFEKALGRRVLWSASSIDFAYVQRLRIYPHALRARNAYYSPAKKALLFGYYPEPNPADVYAVKDMWVFGCLSHDIVAHETSHAILDGINSRFIEDSAPDSLAFHEGLADIVALLQRFTFADAVRSEIGRHVGTLDSPTLLSGLARQFGLASQRTDGLPPGPLRDAVVKDKGTPVDLSNFTEAHQRGARLLSAVYAAFIEIYRIEADKILQIAVPVALGMPLDPRVVDRLAGEAVEAASHLLTMCIRALDYLPPSTVDFGDYLRAIVTADYDLDPVDPSGYRRAIIGTFRRFGVVPNDVRSLAEDSLWWEVCPPRGTASPTDPQPPRKGETELDLDPLFDRQAIFEQSKHNAFVIHELLMADPALCDQLGLLLDARDRQTGAAKLSMAWVANRTSPFEVHSVRMARRVKGDRQLRQLFVTITQWRRGYLDAAVQADVDSGAIPPPEADFKVRGGATLIIDLRAYRSARAPKYGRSSTARTSIFALPRTVIQQPADDDARLGAIRSHRRTVEDAALRLAYAAPAIAGTEPLAIVHAARGTVYAA